MEYCSPRIEDFNLKRLLLLDRGIIVRLCTLEDRVGYLDTTDVGFSHWVWLTKDRVLSVRGYAGQPLPPGSEIPDFVLAGTFGNESVFARKGSDPTGNR